MKDNNKYVLFTLFGLAFLGSILLFFELYYTRYSRYKSPTLENFDQTNFFVGIALILPFVIYIFTRKKKPKFRITKNEFQTHYNISNDNDNNFIFILNGTDHSLVINKTAELYSSDWHILKVNDHEQIYIDVDITIEINKDKRLFIDDFKKQLKTIEKRDYFEFQIPEFVNHAFIISKPDNKFN